jgi:hypothetical protein
VRETVLLGGGLDSATVLPSRRVAGTEVAALCVASPADCENPDPLMVLAKTRVTRELTPSEKLTYLR